MYKCLKIVLSGSLPEDFLSRSISKHSKKLPLEGVAQLQSDGIIKIIVCGDMKHVDRFLDSLYKEIDDVELDELQVEPFAKDRDFRGVFRILS